MPTQSHIVPENNPADIYRTFQKSYNKKLKYIPPYLQYDSGGSYDH